MAYVYTHTREDKNEIFYVGIGSDEDDDHKRALSSGGRNMFWRRIAAKTKVTAQIVVDDITWEEACDKEKELIALYRRKKDGGTLCNLTSGGEGQCGMIPWNKGKATSAHTKRKLSISHMGMVSPLRGIKRPQYVIDAISAALKGKPAWNKGRPCSRETIEKQLKTKAERGSILRGVNHPTFGKKLHSEEQKLKWSKQRKGIEPWNKGIPGNTSHLQKFIVAQRVYVSQHDMAGNLIASYRSINEAARISGAGKGNISLCLKGKRRTAANYIWKYINSCNIRS